MKWTFIHTVRFIIAVFVLTFQALAENQDRPFTHPGLRVGQHEIDLMKQRLAAGEEPWKSDYDHMMREEGFRDGRGRGPLSSLDFRPAPQAVIRVESYERQRIGQDEALTDGAAAFVHGILWQLTGEEQHAQKSVEILDAWAQTLTEVAGPNKELAGAWIVSAFCEAAELVRWSWTDAPEGAWDNFDRMLRNQFWPLLRNFKPRYNGNWDALITQAVVSMGVVLEDRTVYDHGVRYLREGRGNGSLPNYIRADGTTQETKRDQEHEQMGVHALANTAEIAWRQGDDLYALLDNRIRTGAEGTARRIIDLDGIWHNRPGRAIHLYPTWEIIYNHYVHRRGLPMPETKLLMRDFRRNMLRYSRNTVSLWPVLTHHQAGPAPEHDAPE